VPRPLSGEGAGEGGSAARLGSGNSAGARGAAARPRAGRCDPRAAAPAGARRPARAPGAAIAPRRSCGGRHAPRLVRNSRCAMMLALTLLLAQASAPSAEPQGELPAAAVIRARKRPESSRPNRIEGSIVTPGREVSADDIVDELVDEFAADVARLGAAQLSPILLQRVQVSANMNPEYAHIFEARLASAMFKAANLSLVRCVECTAIRSRVEGLAWVVTRGVITSEDVRAIARKYGAHGLLD